MNSTKVTYGYRARKRARREGQFFIIDKMNYGKNKKGKSVKMKELTPLLFLFDSALRELYKPYYKH